jgi:hypothetical protein
MRNFVAFLLGVVTAVSYGSPSLAAPILWYNGEPDYSYSFLISINHNEYYSSSIDLQIYDNFTVPSGQTWTIQELFARHRFMTGVNLTNLTHAEWEIRSGLSSGNPGTLIASGITPVTVTHYGTLIPAVYSDYLLEVGGLNVVLGSGTYWMSLRPITTNMGGPLMSYLARTFGVNAIGSPSGNDGNSFLSEVPFYYFTPYSEISSVEVWDFSMGIRGLQSEATPEPASLAVFTLLAVGAYGLRRRQRAGASNTRLADE